MLFSQFGSFYDPSSKLTDILLPENLTKYEKNFVECPNNILEEGAKPVLAEFIKYKIGNITLDTSVPYLLTEYLHREAIKSKNSGRSLEFKHHLAAGMILCYIRLPQNLNDSKLRSFPLSKLCFVISCRADIDSILKCSQYKFYAKPLSVASDILQQIYSEWYGLYLNPELVNSLNGLSLLNIARDQCYKFEELAVAIRHGKNKISAQERESLAEFMLANPFKDCLQEVLECTESTKHIKQQYMHTVLLLTAWYNPKVNNASYGEKINSIITERMSEDPVSIANRSVYLLTQNQIGKYVMINSQREFAYNLLPFIFSFLRMQIYSNEKYDLLREMRNSLSVESIKMFGGALTKELCSSVGKPFATKTLADIYDLRLGLHDIKHLNNQAKRASELFYAQHDANFRSRELDVMIPEIYSQHIIFSSSLNYDLDALAKRRLACGQYSMSNTELSYSELRDVMRFLKAVNTEKFIANDYAGQKHLQISDRCLNNLSSVVESLKQIFNKVVSATDEKTRLYIDGTLRLKINYIAPVTEAESNSGFILGQLYCSFSYLGDGKWVMHEPSLPQGYIRFAYKQIFDVARHIVEYCLDLLTEEQRKYGLRIKYIDLCPLRIDNFQRITVRRTITPAPLDNDLINPGAKSLHRSSTAMGSLRY